LVPLALKQDAEAHERTDLQHAVTVDATVARAPGDGDFLESRLAEQTLAESLETRSWQPAEEFEKPYAVACGGEASVILLRRRLRFIRGGAGTALPISAELVLNAPEQLVGVLVCEPLARQASFCERPDSPG
jgi:hypothetical protein